MKEEIVEFGDLKEGDLIKGSDGKPVRVSRSYDVHIPEKSYRIEGEDGEVIVASGNHLWYLETDIDIALHSARVSEARKIFRELDPQTIEFLEEMASFESERGKDGIILSSRAVSMNELLGILFTENDSSKIAVVGRICISVGPIQEDSYLIYDVESDSHYKANSNIPIYSFPEVSRQILPLTGKRKYRKFPVLRGSVVTTDKLFLMQETGSIVKFESTFPLA